jgi:hypothetical protein
MTMDTAVFAAGSILVAAVVWQTHRLNSRRLGEIRNDLDGLRVLASRLLLNQTPKETVASQTDSGPGQGDPCGPEGTPAPPTDLDPELTEIDLLCAKLITLSPPAVALPLLAEPEAPQDDQGSPRDGRERLRPWPQR